jgi:alpha-D-ribose 1-methylphosphonate 5-triphosphate synthase subunit PhnL
VIGLIDEARERGAALLGIFHDQAVRQAVATRLFAMPGAARIGSAA